MPTRAERETVIVANLADLDEGWFTVETTELSLYRRLRRIAGVARLQVLHVDRDAKGREWHWLCRVPADCWTGLGVRRKQVLTEAQRQARIASGLKLANTRIGKS